MSLAQVKEFHEAFGHPVADRPTIPPRERIKLRSRLIIEELEETVRDALNGDIVKFADGLSDLSVVINGSLLEFGFTELAPGGQEYYTPENEEKKKPYIPTLLHLTDLIEIIKRDLQILWSADENSNPDKIIDALIDMKFWVALRASGWGIPLEEIDSVVHKANMSKLGEDGKPIYRESDNKILKGPNFRPPEEDIERILREHGADL